MEPQNILRVSDESDVVFVSSTGEADDRPDSSLVKMIAAVLISVAVLVLISAPLALLIGMGAFVMFVAEMLWERPVEPAAPRTDQPAAIIPGATTRSD